MGDTFRFRAWHAAAFLAAVSAVSAASSTKDVRLYWKGLDRHTVAPPRWVFPAVWTTLNALQLWADLRILNDHKASDRPAVIGLRAVSWAMSALVSRSVSGAESPLAPAAVTLAEGVTAGAAMALLVRSDPLAAVALAPLTLWNAYTNLIGGEATSAKREGLVDRLRWQGAF
jgi:tryptophan-rich sensory protein